MSVMLILSHFVLWALVIALCVTSMRMMRTPAPRRPELPLNDQGLPPGTPFPAITLMQSAGTGPALPTLGRAGGLVVLTSIGCPTCTGLYPQLASYRIRHPELGVSLLVRGTEQDVKLILEQNSLSVPATTLTPELARQLQSPAYPFTYFLSPDGRVIAKGMAASEASLDLLLQSGRRPASDSSSLPAL